MTTLAEQSSETDAQQSAVEPSQPFAISETEWAEIKALLDKRYSEIAALLRYNKTKDESIQRLSAEVQKYRDGFAFSALKPFINALIALREDCRKSKRDAEQSAIDNKMVKKYTEYLVLDFEELLSNIGLERNDGSISLNGKPFSNLTQPKELPAEPSVSEQKEEEISQTESNSETINSVPELIENLKRNENSIQFVLKDRKVIDETIREYIALAAQTDAEHYLALIAPLSRQIYALYDSVSKKAALSSDLTFYKDTLGFISEEIGNILTGIGIEIKSDAEILLDKVFDTKKHKLLKTVPTSDESLDRTIAKVYTDCYINNEKVVYPSKVEVYKFQKV